MSDRLDAILAKLEEAKRRGDQATALCPAHEDTRASLSLKITTLGKIVVICHAGCSPEAVVAKLGLTMADLFPPTTSKPGGLGKAADEYTYTDEAGAALYQVVRFEPKDFRIRRADSVGGWSWGFGDARRVLYRLPDVHEAIRGDQDIYIVEGEKDVDRLRRAGVVATCNPSGAGKWRAEYSESLNGARVLVVADRDEPGRQHAADVARQLTGVAASVRVVEPAAGKDVSDHLAAGHSLAELVAAPEVMSFPYVGKISPGCTQAERQPPGNAELEHLTDLGNARRLVARHGADLRYARGIGCLVWDGCRWRVDDTGEIERRAKDTIRALYDEALALPDAERLRLVKHAIASESGGRLAAMVRLAETETAVAARAADFDGDPMLFTGANGTVDLRTGELRPPRRGDLITKAAPVTFDSCAVCPGWDTFLRDVTGDKPDLAPSSSGPSATASPGAPARTRSSSVGVEGKTARPCSSKHSVGCSATTGRRRGSAP